MAIFCELKRASKVSSVNVINTVTVRCRWSSFHRKNYGNNLLNFTVKNLKSHVNKVVCRVPVLISVLYLE